MNKVIAFSLYGDIPKYTVGAEKNIEIIKQQLPDWHIKIYSSPFQTDPGFLTKLSDMGAEIVDVSTISLLERNYWDYSASWRFMEFFTDSIAISRDLDSRIFPREITYLNRWLESDCDFFIIRDHPWHSPVPAGLIGMRNHGEEFKNFFVDFYTSDPCIWGHDQEILYRYINLQDPSNIFYCGFDRPETYIPRDDKRFFIGMQLDENDEPTVPSGVQCLDFLNELNL